MYNIISQLMNTSYTRTTCKREEFFQRELNCLCFLHGNVCSFLLRVQSGCLNPQWHGIFASSSALKRVIDYSHG